MYTKTGPAEAGFSYDSAAEGEPRKGTPGEAPEAFSSANKLGKMQAETGKDSRPRYGRGISNDCTSLK
jgi:hypothetical protein